MSKESKDMVRTAPGRDGGEGVSAHTAGPWYVSPFEITTGGKSRVVMGADGFSIAHIMDRTAAENEADARLIAAAPDLTSALANMVHALDAACSPDCDIFAAKIAAPRAWAVELLAEVSQ